MELLTGKVLHLFVLAAVAFWTLRRPLPGLRGVFVCWWTGLVLYRVAPLGVLLAAGRTETPEPGPVVLAFFLISWLGVLLLFRAALALILWDRPHSKRFWAWAGLFVLGQVLGAAVSASAFAVILLCLPLLFSYRWRSQCKAVGLLQANLAFLLTFLMGIISVGPQSEATGSWPEGLRRSADLMLPVILIYSAMGIFATARRIHLSIRRIGRRLVVSHLLVSLIPSILVGLFLLLSGALFVSTYRGLVTARLIQSDAEDAVAVIDQSMRETGNPPQAPFGRITLDQTVMIRGDGPARLISGRPPQRPWRMLFLKDLSTQDAPLLWDGATLYLRARWDGVGAVGDSVRVEALAPLDSLRMAQFSDLLGVPARISPQFRVNSTGAGVSFNPSERTEESEPAGEELERSGELSRREPRQELDREAQEGREAQTRPGSIGPSDSGTWRLPGGSIVSVLIWEEPEEAETEEDAGGEETDGPAVTPGTPGRWTLVSMPVISSAGFGEQIGSLFTKAQENPLATVVLIVLGFLAAFLLGTVWVTVAMVVEMVRSITASVRALTLATQALGRGDFSYRIDLKDQDELWDVAGSFNHMAEDLARMQATELERQRMEEDLRLAREIQTRLLPSSAPVVPNLELAGTSVPAREVGGDYYDYILLPDGQVGLVVADVSGKGTPAALLMSAFRAALRSQDLTASGPAEVLGRVNGFIHSSVDPGRFITAFVAVMDPKSGIIRYANAGHDAPILLRPDGSMTELTGGGLILGMLPKIAYEEASAQIGKGETVVVFTDGVTEARDSQGEFFGMKLLKEGLEQGVGGTTEQILERLMDEIRSFRGEEPQSDDITLILARRT